MLTRTACILALATLTLAHPSLQARQLEGSCTNFHLPTEALYTLGYQSFCDTYIPSPDPKILTEGQPLVATFDLTDHDGKTVRWVYKVSVADNTDLVPIYQLTRDTCKEKFKGILETQAGGGLGKAYCVVDGTGGDKVGVEGMSGEGVVLVMGGTVKERAAEGQNGFVYWETRGRVDG